MKPGSGEREVRVRKRSRVAVLAAFFMFAGCDSAPAPSGEAPADEDGVAGRLDVRDVIEFVHDRVLPRVSIVQREGTVAVHAVYIDYGTIPITVDSPTPVGSVDALPLETRCYLRRPVAAPSDAAVEPLAAFTERAAGEILFRRDDNAEVRIASPPSLVVLVDVQAGGSFGHEHAVFAQSGDRIRVAEHVRVGGEHHVDVLELAVQAMALMRQRRVERRRLALLLGAVLRVRLDVHAGELE